MILKYHDEDFEEVFLTTGFQLLETIDQKAHFQSHCTVNMLVFKHFFFHDHQIMQSEPKFSPQRPFNLAHPQLESYHQPPLPWCAQVELKKYSRCSSIYCSHTCFIVFVI